MSSHIFRMAALATVLIGTPCISAHAADPEGSLVKNGDFEADTDTDQWPDQWGRLKEGGFYEVENGNHFLRLTSPEPGKMILLYREIRIPVGTKAVELTWKQRVTNLKRGKNSWFDARIMMNWLDDARNKQNNPGPPAPNTSKDTVGWVERSAKFLVPEKATMLALMPTLFQVETGTFDLDDVVLKPLADAMELEAAKGTKTTDTAPPATATAARQEKAAANLATGGSFAPNGDFQTDANGDTVPDDWSPAKPPQMTWETEGDNRFLRLTSTEPGKLVMHYRLVDIPAGVKAVDLTWKQRITGLKPGKEAWFDARIMLDFKDAAGNKLKGGPGAPYSRRDTTGWVEKSLSFLVPEGATTLEFMPSLFQVQSGTLDLDDIVFKTGNVATLLAAKAKADEDAKYINVPAEAPNPAKWPQEIKVQGNRIVTGDGKPVTLKGVNIDSLQWSLTGERVMRNTLVSVDDWKANIIRLPVKEDYWFGRASGQKDGGESYRKLVDNTITLAANRGAYVLLDLHRFRAPKREHVEFWKDAAAKYKNHSAVIFEIFNEPHGISWEVWRNGGFVEDKNAPADEDNFLTPEEKARNARGFHSVGIQALVNAVRETGAKNVVVAGGLDWAYDLTGILKGYALDDKGGNGIMYCSHIYAGKRDWQNKVLAAAENYPIIVSEFGATNKKFEFMPAASQEDAGTWVPKVFGFIQKHNLNWTAFSFHPSSAPNMLVDWSYKPTPEWGGVVKRALAGETFPDAGMR